MDGSIALVEFSKPSRRAGVEPFEYAHIEVGLNIWFRHRRALLLELSREQKMQRDLILAMTLMSMKQDPPFLVKKVIRLLRTAGWRVINKHWHEAINFCIQQGSIRASLRDNGLAFEVFWPK